MSPLATPAFEPLVPGRIWVRSYPVHYSGLDFRGRVTLLRLTDGQVLVHSPSPIDDAVFEAASEVGSVAHIIAPGSYHYFHVSAWQERFPDATVWICPGIERKRPELEFDWFLADRPPTAWENEVDQVLVRGNRLMWEVVFLDKPSRTLIVTDLVENIGSHTSDTDWKLELWWKVIFRMWDRPKPAPEYQMGWKDKRAAKQSLERILAWDFDKVVLSHGENILTDAKETVRKAWARPLSFDS